MAPMEISNKNIMTVVNRASELAVDTGKSIGNKLSINLSDLSEVYDKIIDHTLLHKDNLFIFLDNKKEILSQFFPKVEPKKVAVELGKCALLFPVYAYKGLVAYGREGTDLCQQLSSSCAESIIQATGSLKHLLEDINKNFSMLSVNGKNLECTMEFDDGNTKLEFKESAVRADTVNFLVKENEQAADILNELKNNKVITDCYGTGSIKKIFKFFRGRTEGKKNCPPLLMNLRHQKVEEKVDGKDCVLSQFNRSGAITDFANNETNLGYMQEYVSLIDPIKDKAETLASIRNFYPEFKNMDEETIKKCIKKTIIHAYGLKGLDGKAFDDKVAELTTERTKRLQSQFLQDLLLHHQNGTLVNQLDSSTVTYCRTSLVNTKKKPQDKAGEPYLSERNMCLDAYTILSKMDGKIIIFDQTDRDKAYIDEKGHIHLPRRTDGGVTESTLETMFSNISASGNTTNSGLQKAINEKCLNKIQDKINRLTKIINDLPAAKSKKLKDELGEIIILYRSLHETLSAGRGGIRAAEKMAILMQKLGALSVNCYGGKDRTGIICAAISFYNMCKHITKNKQIDQTTIAAPLAALGRRMADAKSILMSVAKDNTGFPGVKLFLNQLDLAVILGRIPGSDAYLVKDRGESLENYLDKAKRLAIYLDKGEHLANYLDKAKHLAKYLEKAELLTKSIPTWLASWGKVAGVSAVPLVHATVGRFSQSETS